MVLDESIGELELGRELNSYDIFNDEFIEIELTPNRGDCLSVYGVARDLAVALELDLNEKKEFKESENALGIGRILRLGVTRDLNSLLMYRAFELKEELHNKLLINLRLAQAELLSQNSKKIYSITPLTQREFYLMLMILISLRKTMMS